MEKVCYLGFVGCTLALFASMVTAGNDMPLKGGIPENLPEIHLEHGSLISPHASLRRLHCVEENLSYEIQWDAYPAARLTHLLKSGSVDFALPLSKSPERDASFGAFIPLGINADLLIHLSPQLPAENKDTVIGVMRGTIQANIAEQRGYQLMKVNEIEVLMRLLLAKRVDAIAVTEKYVNANEASWVQPTYLTPFRREIFGIYFSKSAAKVAVAEFALVASRCNNSVQEKSP